MLTKECKQELIKKFQTSEKDTGSSEVQLACITEHINHISGHLKNFPKDNHSRRGLVLLVGKKRRLSRYLKKSNPEKYRALEKQLHLKT